MYEYMLHSKHQKFKHVRTVAFVTPNVLGLPQGKKIYISPLPKKVNSFSLANI